MKTRIAIVALLLVGLVPMTTAQEQPFMEDASGDAKMIVAGSPTSPLADNGDPIDLRSLDVIELPNGFELTLQVKALETPTQTFLDRAAYYIHFHMGGVDYAVVTFADYGLIGGGAFYYSYLAEVDPEADYDRYIYRDEIDLNVDLASAQLKATVHRTSITDTLGAPASAGAVLQDFYVVAKKEQFSFEMPDGEEFYTVHDRMPDTGFGPSFESLLGVVQTGDARLWSPAPFRLSNGGATSMVYQVEATNMGERQTFKLDASKVPAGWEVTLPYDRIALDEDETKSFPVLVTTQSGHQHGGSKAFLLTMTGQQDNADVGRVEIGVTYPTVPQPAGHHPKLWFHTEDPWGSAQGILGEAIGSVFGSSVQGYMNALEDDPSDLGLPVPGRGVYLPGLEGYFNWWIPLSPDLGMGLDFDVAKQATLSLPLNFDYVAQDVVVSGGLYLWSPDHDDGLQVGSIQPSTPTSWTRSTHTFDLVMDIKKEADFIAYTPNAYLYLELEAEGQFIGVGPLGPGAQLSLMPGGSMELPLNEYRDEVKAFYSQLDSLRFGADFIERPVNPGKTLVFETHLRNMEDKAQDVQLNVSGVNVEWARILGDSAFTIGAGQERTVAVAVVVPAEAVDGGIVDLVLTASNANDPFKAAVIDLIAIIDTEADHPDEADKIGSLDIKSSANKKSPGFEIVAVALGLIAIALVLRRRA